MYTAKLLTLGKTYTAEGATIAEAIGALKPGNIKAKAILTLSRMTDEGLKTKERIIMPRIAMRLFNTMGTTREILLKNTSLLFDGFV